METARLQIMQRPSHIDGLLQSLAKSLGVVPDDADAVHDRSELPSALQRVVRQAQKAAQSWRCWIDRGFRIWLFTAQVSLPLSRAHGSPVLQVKHYREDGLRETNNWLVDQRGKWHRVVE